MTKESIVDYLIIFTSIMWDEKGIMPNILEEGEVSSLAMQLPLNTQHR